MFRDVPECSIFPVLSTPRSKVVVQTQISDEEGFFDFFGVCLQYSFLDNSYSDRMMTLLICFSALVFHSKTLITLNKTHLSKFPFTFT